MTYLKHLPTKQLDGPKGRCCQRTAEGQRCDANYNSLQLGLCAAKLVRQLLSMILFDDQLAGHSSMRVTIQSTNICCPMHQFFTTETQTSEMKCNPLGNSLALKQPPQGFPVSWPVAAT